MRMIEKFTYKELSNWLSLLAGISIAIITVALSVLFYYHCISYDVFKKFIIGICFIAVFSCTFIGIYWQRKSDIYSRYWPAFAIILGISNGFLAGLMGRTLLLVTNDFGGLIRHILIASTIIALFGGIASFLSLRIVHRLSQSHFLFYIAAAYSIGVGCATVNTHIFDWWYSSICSLGMPSHQNSDIYNSTLVIIGMLMALFIAYMVPQFRILLQKDLISRPKIVAIFIIYLLELIGIMLVGIFPFGYNHFVATTHIFFGAFVFYDMGVLMLLAAWLFSGFPNKFLVTNYLLLIAGFMCYSTGYILCFIIKVKWLPFTLAEFITAIIIIAWFLMTLSYIKRLR